MKVETKTLPSGQLHHQAFAVLPQSGRVPIDLHALDAPGWVAQSAKWFKDTPEDVAALFDAVVASCAYADLEPTPAFTYVSVPWTIRRRKAYPKMGDQLDMIYKAAKAGDFSLTDFVAAIDAAKASVPKEN